MIFNIKIQKVNFNSIALAILLVSNICFYNATDIYIYRILSFLGIAVVFFTNIGSFSTKIRINNCILWLCFVYAVILFNGEFRLKAGEFNFDIIIVRLFEAISLYIAMNALIQQSIEKVISPFIFAGLFSIVVLVVKEGTSIILGGMRLGESLSGNSNTVGFNIGIVSMFAVWKYCIKKEKKTIVLFVILALFVLLTGSKKALIIILFDFLMILIYQKKNASIWLKVFLGLIGLVYLVFNVSYFYNIIGIRIESMFMTWRYGNVSQYYSYSTNMREYMIIEGFRFFLSKPVFGGGYNYFYSLTSTNYDYSHCNYIELLCSFGVVGTFIFYSKHLWNLYTLVNGKYIYVDNNRNLRIMALLILIVGMLLDWAAVTFSAQAIWYIPVIFSSVAIEQIIRNFEIEENIFT